jgi:hypothetical protein
MSKLRRIGVIFAGICILLICYGIGLKIREINKGDVNSKKLFLIDQFVKGRMVYGYIDRTGHVVVKPSYSSADSFKDGMASISTGTAYGFIDSNGKVAIRPIYSSAMNFSEGLASVSKGMKYGYIDKNGRAAFKGDYAGDEFHEGLAAVATSKGWGYIDKSGRYVIKPQFAEALDFESGLALVYFKRNDQKFKAYIDKKGKIVWQRKYTKDELDWLSRFDCNFGWP